MVMLAEVPRPREIGKEVREPESEGGARHVRRGQTGRIAPLICRLEYIYGADGSYCGPPVNLAPLSPGGIPV